MKIEIQVWDKEVIGGKLIILIDIDNIDVIENNLYAYKEEKSVELFLKSGRSYTLVSTYKELKELLNLKSKD